MRTAKIIIERTPGGMFDGTLEMDNRQYIKSLSETQSRAVRCLAEFAIDNLQAERIEVVETWDSVNAGRADEAFVGKAEDGL